MKIRNYFSFPISLPKYLTSKSSDSPYTIIARNFNILNCAIEKSCCTVFKYLPVAFLKDYFNINTIKTSKYLILHVRIQSFRYFSRTHMLQKNKKVSNYAFMSPVKNTHANISTNKRCCIGGDHRVPYKNWKKRPPRAYGTFS
jgi:hypothetical protein